MRRYADAAFDLLRESESGEILFNDKTLEDIARLCENVNNLRHDKWLISIDRTIRAQVEREESETRFRIERRGRGRTFLVRNPGRGGNSARLVTPEPLPPSPFRFAVHGSLAEAMFEAVNAGIAPEQIVRDGIAANLERIRAAINAKLDSLLGGSLEKGAPNE